MIRRCVFDALEPRLLLTTTRLAVIGDFSSDVQTAPTQDVSNLVKGWNPDAVVTTGDNNYPVGGADTIDANIGQWYHQFIYPYTGSYGAGSADHVNHFWPTLGRHDWMTTNAQPYLDYFTLPGNERYYTVTQGVVQLFIVDGWQDPDGTNSTSVQATWLHNQLAASTAAWKLVIFHPPAYTSGGEGNNTWMRWPFQAWGATAVISGHDHDYERLNIGGLPYFVDGLGGESIVGFSTTEPGSQVRYAGDYGAMRIDANDTSITFTFITRTGVTIDTYTISQSAGLPVSYISQGSTWKYLVTPSAAPSAWKSIGFTETGWGAGPAQLGYGDGDEATVLGYGPDANHKYITTYFRKTFNITDPSVVQTLNLQLLRDDGAVVYLNGTEVFRDNMPSGTISYSTVASTNVGGADESTWFPASINPALLQAGNNVIAVEVHQSVETSSDLSFDFQLAGTTTPPTTVALDGSSRLTITDTGGAAGKSDQLTLTADSPNNRYIVTDPNNLIGTPLAAATGNGTHTLYVPFSAFSGGQIIVGLLGGNDTIVVNGTVVPVSIDAGSGTDTITIAETSAAAVTIAASAGNDTVNVNSDGSGSAIVSLGSAAQHLGALTIGNGGSVTLGTNGNSYIQAGTLSIGAAGKLDLNDNDLIVNSAAFTTVRGYVFAGYSSTPDPSKQGIISSTGQTAGNTILAMFDNALVGTTEWPLGSGNTVPAGAIIGKYTYFGDMDFDGKVTADDYAILDANFGATPNPGLAWLSGDANLDGRITADDYGILDANLGAGAGNPL